MSKFEQIFQIIAKIFFLHARTNNHEIGFFTGFYPSSLCEKSLVRLHKTFVQISIEVYTGQKG